MAVTAAKTRAAKLLSELGPTDIYRICDPSTLGFQSTAELPELKEIIGQDRAVSSVHFGIGIQSEGYNIFAMGPIVWVESMSECQTMHPSIPYASVPHSLIV